MTFSAEYVWGTWLALFLTYELWAAASKRKGDTLSENVGDWIGVARWQQAPRRFSPLRRLILFLFMGALTYHLVWGGTVVPVIVFGVALGAVVLWGILREK